MTYQMDVTVEDNYLHIRVTGNANFANASSLWKRIADVCNEHQCFNVLGEQNLRNAMPTMDAWNHQKIFLDAGITAKFKIAWVDVNPKTYDATDFIRTVLYNRDIGYGKLFSDIAIAKKWLLHDANT